MYFLEVASQKPFLIHMWSLGQILKADTYSSSLLTYRLSFVAQSQQT